MSTEYFVCESSRGLKQGLMLHLYYRRVTTAAIEHKTILIDGSPTDGVSVCFGIDEDAEQIMVEFSERNKYAMKTFALENPPELMPDQILLLKTHIEDGDSPRRQSSGEETVAKQTLNDSGVLICKKEEKKLGVFTWIKPRIAKYILSLSRVNQKVEVIATTFIRRPRQLKLVLRKLNRDLKVDVDLYSKDWEWYIWHQLLEKNMIENNETIFCYAIERERQNPTQTQPCLQQIFAIEEIGNQEKLFVYSVFNIAAYNQDFHRFIFESYFGTPPRSPSCDDNLDLRVKKMELDADTDRIRVASQASVQIETAAEEAKTKQLEITEKTKIAIAAEEKKTKRLEIAAKIAAEEEKTKRLEMQEETKRFFGLFLFIVILLVAHALNK